MLIIEVKVVPSSGKNKWMLDKMGRLRCYLKNPPERGLANHELIKLLAQTLKITQQDVEIVSGATARTKRVKINLLLTFDQLLAKLGIEQQSMMFK